jgi:hypothetical protein
MDNDYMPRRCRFYLYKNVQTVCIFTLRDKPIMHYLFYRRYSYMKGGGPKPNMSI